MSEDLDTLKDPVIQGAEPPIVAQGDESPIDAIKIMMLWQGLWLATIGRYWAIKATPGKIEDKDETWLKKLLSRQPEEVAKAIQEQASTPTGNLPEHLELEVHEATATWNADGDLVRLDKNHLILKIPSLPKPPNPTNAAYIQARAITSYMRSGRVYPFTTF